MTSKPLPTALTEGPRCAEGNGVVVVRVGQNSLTKQAPGRECYGEREAACFGRGQSSTFDTRNGVPCYTVALDVQTGDAVGLRMVTVPVLHKELSLSHTHATLKSDRNQRTDSVQSVHTAPGSSDDLIMYRGYLKARAGRVSDHVRSEAVHGAGRSHIPVQCIGNAECQP